jgi:spore photoproduct lyase
MSGFHPEKVFVEKAAAEMPRTKAILGRIGQAEISIIEDYRDIEIPGESLDDRYRLAKKCLALAVKKGRMVKEFRRHSCLRQGREYYLIHAANCPFDCSYCYLQSYYENAIPTIFANTGKLFEQVAEVLETEPGEKILFHAGETADALSLEHLSGFAADAVGFFAQFENATLELRTKSAAVEPILPLDQRGRTVVSWTLTPVEIIERYERGAASLENRLKAASMCGGAGFPIGLRFDPIIHCDGRQQGYRELIEQIAESLAPEVIHSIVLGGFRFPPRLREIMVERFGRGELTLGEFVPSPDGKIRYFRHIREEMYRKIIGMMQKVLGPEIASRIELAMEPEYIWDNIGLPAEK